MRRRRRRKAAGPGCAAPSPFTFPLPDKMAAAAPSGDRAAAPLRPGRRPEPRHSPDTAPRLSPPAPQGCVEAEGPARCPRTTYAHIAAVARSIPCGRGCPGAERGARRPLLCSPEEKHRRGGGRNDLMALFHHSFFWAGWSQFALGNDIGSFGIMRMYKYHTVSPHPVGISAPQKTCPLLDLSARADP